MNREVDGCTKDVENDVRSHKLDVDCRRVNESLSPERRTWCASKQSDEKGLVQPRRLQRIWSKPEYVFVLKCKIKQV